MRTPILPFSSPASRDYGQIMSESTVPQIMTQSIPPKSLVLIGFMGSGKSTVGRKLQDRLGYPLVDTDQEIEKRAGKSISEIFAEDGEDAFRKMETELLRELNSPEAPRRIISTGGGIIGREENRKLLREIGYVVWLKAPAETILERTAKNKSRPLLQTDNPMVQIDELMKKRQPLYEETAHQPVSTADLDSDEVATGILECARYYFTHSS